MFLRLSGWRSIFTFALFDPTSKPIPLNLHGLYVISLHLPNESPAAVLHVHNSAYFQSCSRLTCGTPDCEHFLCHFFQTVYSRSLHIMAHESHNECLTGHLCYVYSRKKDLSGFTWESWILNVGGKKVKKRDKKIRPDKYNACILFL